MNIQDINGKAVKLSAGTITVKDENGKTCGLVRGVTRFKDARANLQFEFSRQLRASGIWEAGKSDSVYIDGKTLYYIENRRTAEHYSDERIREAFPDEVARFETIRESATAAGVVVLSCYL